MPPRAYSHSYTPCLKLLLTLACVVLWGGFPEPASAITLEEVDPLLVESDVRDTSIESESKRDIGSVVPLSDEEHVASAPFGYEVDSESNVTEIDVEDGPNGMQEVGMAASTHDMPSVADDGLTRVSTESEGETIAFEVESITQPTQSIGNVVASGTWGTCPWEIATNGVLTIHPGNAGTDWPWTDYADRIASVRMVREDMSEVILPTDCKSLFSRFTTATSMDLSGADASKVSNMHSMFAGCSRLITLDLDGWDVSSVTDMGSLFAQCSMLTELKGIGEWNTTSVMLMCHAFQDCSSLTSLELSDWNVSSVTDMRYMFNACSSLANLDLSGWDVSSVVNLESIFSGCSSLKTVNLYGWKTSSTTCMRFVFNGCSSLSNLDLSGWDVSSVTDTGYMFYNCSSLVSLNLSGWDTSKVTYTGWMFHNCSSLVSLDLSGWDMSSLSYASFMFQNCHSLKTIDATGWKLGRNAPSFYGCPMLTEIKGISEWDTSCVSDMAHMFYGCSSLATLSVGANYLMNSSDAFPQTTSTSNRWWSEADKRWYTHNEIVSSRSKVADTYTTVPSLDYARSISSLSITPPKARPYTGKSLTPDVTLKDGNYTLCAGLDYTLSYKDNVNVGTASITVVGKGDYKGTQNASFAITRAKVAAPKAANHTYNGKVQVGVTSGKGYTLSGTARATNAGNYETTATPDANHCWSDGTITAKAIKWKLAKATSSISIATQTKTYTGKRIAYSGKVSRSGSKGKVTYRYYNDKACTKAVKPANIKTAKTYWVIATLAADTNHKSAKSKATKFVVAKANNPIVAKAIAQKVSAKTLKRKSVTVAKAFSVNKAQGTVTYTKIASGSSKCLTVKKASGKITVKKGVKKGTYKIKVKITAAGNTNYKAGSKIVICKVTVA